MPHTPIKQWTPDEDAADLQRMYAEHPAKLPHITPEGFVRSVAWRVYIEYCCNNQEADWSQHVDYDGAAYRKWVANEIHFALERQGGNADEAKYRQVREQIMHAVVDRMVELLNAWNGRDYPMDETKDRRNLRDSLQPYLERQA